MAPLIDFAGDEGEGTNEDCFAGDVLIDSRTDGFSFADSVSIAVGLDCRSIGVAQVSLHDQIEH